MRVKITLYPTTFDKDNIFVGSQSLTRENEIDTFYADTKLELPLSAYNAERPFRVHGNFLLYDRKYNYAKYQLYDNTNADTPLDTRYYFILRYDYVNDNVTDLVVVEDIIGSHFWDIKLSRCLPQNYTYKDEVVNLKKYNPLSNYKLFKKNNVTDNLFKFTYNERDYIAGFLMLPCERMSAIDSHPPTFGYGEDRTAYPFSLFLFPIVYDISKNSSISSFSRMYIGGSEWLGVSDDNIDVIVDGKKYTRIITADANIILPQGKKPYAAYLWLDCKNYIDSIEVKQDPQFSTNALFIQMKFHRTLNNKNYSTYYSGWADYSQEGLIQEYAYLLIDNNNTIADYIPASKLPHRIDKEQLCVDEYYKISIETNDLSVDLPTKILSSENSEDIGLYFAQSFVPPFTKTIFYDISPNNINDQIEYKTKYSVSVSPDNNFILFDDSYSEWYRNNYNSAITSLRSQKLQSAVDVTSGAVNWLNNMAIFGQNGIVGGGAAMLNKTLQATTNNIKAENAYTAKIIDAKNATDNIVFNGTGALAFQTQKYTKIVVWQNANISAIRFYHTCYGFDCGVIIPYGQIQAHDRFDYLQAVDITFENDIPFNEKDLINIENAINDGIRVWYTLEYFKNFAVVNNEI